MTTQKTRIKIIDAFLSLARDVDWAELNVAAIADKANVSLSVLRRTYDGKLAILEDHLRHVDARVLDALDDESAEESTRDRLFDVLMQRFDVLAPHKTALRRLRGAAIRDPLLAAAFARLVLVSQSWMLAAAGISTSGLGGIVRAQGLAVAYARVFHTWLDDDDVGLAKTMASLDRTLRRGERALNRLECVGRILKPFAPRRRDAANTTRDNASEPDAA
jgi:AcrR family transcriptional regulator